eukprot:gb/GEZN01009909.1/.p1 GENE.gb/GEZN01009909.1/~~gb/GEZN01009909.1/.p1  ORF type:complete len:343 (-),score=73.22 gb/GEZN01009909.1/:256-1257(-)
MLWERLGSAVHCLGLPLLSRVHQLPALRRQTAPAYRVWVKRDDELGGVFQNGSKLRKYASLLPALLQARKQFLQACPSHKDVTGAAAAAAPRVKVALVGGESSNNLLGLATLLLEQDFHPVLILYQSHFTETHDTGNAGWLRFLAGQTGTDQASANTHCTVLGGLPFRVAQDRQALLTWLRDTHQLSVWTAGSQTSFVPDSAAPPLLAVIPEGACCAWSIEGALSLAADLELQLNPQQSSRTTDTDALLQPMLPSRLAHVFLDSGTGMTASATIWAFHWLQLMHNHKLGKIVSPSSVLSSSSLLFFFFLFFFIFFFFVFFIYNYYYYWHHHHY